MRIWENSKSNNHWIWFFKNPLKELFSGQLFNFFKIWRTVVICLNRVFGFSENRDYGWTLRATPIQGGVSNTYPTSSVTLKNLKRSEFSMFFMESSLVFLVIPNRFQLVLDGYQKCEQTPDGQFHS